MNAHQIDGFPAVACLANDPQVHMFREKLAQPGTDYRMVIHNANLDH
ncbi:hypothetical protein [[Acidovorax] ebreus]|nr:hypothetical protein MRB47_04935 [Diaphorobacter sp. LI3]